MSYTKKYTWLLILALTFAINQSTFAQDIILDQEVSITFEDLSIKESLKKLESSTGITTAFNERELADDKITITFEKNLLSEVLDALLTNENLAYKVVGNTVAIYKKEVSPELAPDPIVKKEKLATDKKITKRTISGYVMADQSNETLIGASIYVSSADQGTITNEYGFYSITLPEGEYEITYSYIGFQSEVINVSLDANTEISQALQQGNQISEVVITDKTEQLRHQTTQMSSNKISLEKLEAMPALMGERDVLKLIQLMPGVQSGGEGTTGLYVRGGGPDQNLMLLDGVPVYNASHLFGFLSTFNGDAIKSAELIKGGFPARHGGRLSSIIDVRMKEGNMKKLAGDFTVGLIAGRFNLEGPIVKDKTSFSFSGRRTWFDLLSTPAQRIANKSAQPGDTKTLNSYNLHDINAKINHRFSSKSRLYLSSYLGSDKLINKGDDGFGSWDGSMTWGNKIASARWNYQLGPKLFSNATLYYSGYDFDFKDTVIEGFKTSSPLIEKYSSNSSIKDYGIKLDLNYIPHPNHYLRGGVKYGKLEFKPTTTYIETKEGSEPAESLASGDPVVKNIEVNGYIEDDIRINKSIKMNIGAHISHFRVDSNQYTSVQPRVALNYQLSNKSSIKASFTKMTQFVHLLASQGLGLPTDLWVSSTKKIKPENSWQYGLGYTRSLGNGFELTLESYYKQMENLVEYKSGFNFFSSSSNWQDKVDIGKGRSYGGEVLIQKTLGKTTGWLGYTLSWSERTFPNINNGKRFPYKYDRRNDIGLAITHKKSERIDFGLVWVYGSGNTYTLGTSNYNALGINTQESATGNPFSQLGTTNHINSKNNQRQPSYHRLDLSVNLHKMKKRGQRTWSFGVYNAYARQNPFLVYLDQANPFNPESKIVLKQQSLLPILPYFSYSFKF